MRFNPIDNPEHYVKNRKIQPIEVIEDWKLSFCIGNAVKYLSRYDRKGKPIEDLKKAKWYIEREIERLGKEEVKLESPTCATNDYKETSEYWDRVVKGEEI